MTRTRAPHDSGPSQRRSREITRAWQCEPPRLQLVVVADPLAARLSPPYSPAGAALIAEAAVTDTLAAVAAAPVGYRVAESLRGRGPGLLVRTSTPQVSPELLADAAAQLGRFDAVLGPTGDGGWWAFGVREADRSAELASLAEAGPLTLAALRRGLRVAMLPTLQRVTTAADAHEVAARCRPGAGFAAAVAGAAPADDRSGRPR
jgi:glycosyltransferase A (GT-A) superfamily protein (DUF2064 family)